MATLSADLQRFGKKVYSQNDEDGVIERIASDLGILSGFFVEIGVGPPWGRTFAEAGLEANCRLLRERGWQGLFVDAQELPTEAHVVTAEITPFNVNTLLRKQAVPEDFDLLSIDIDGQDFWVWMNLVFQPRIVVIEYNASIPLDVSCVVPLLPHFRWDGTNWFGASLAALIKLADSRFYTLVHANGVNAFFVRSDLFVNHRDFAPSGSYIRKPIHPSDLHNRDFVTV